MGKKIRMILAVAVIIATATWSFNSVRQRNHSGSKFFFEVGSGHVVVTNPGNEALPVEMRSQGRAATFTIQSTDLGLRETARRVGAGRNAHYAVQFDLPPGQSKIDVTRGSNVIFLSSSGQRIEATVTPLEAGGVRTNIGFAIIVILAALHYISKLQNHQWLKAVGAKISDRLPLLRRRMA